MTNVMLSIYTIIKLYILLLFISVANVFIHELFSTTGSIVVTFGVIISVFFCHSIEIYNWWNSFTYLGFYFYNIATFNISNFILNFLFLLLSIISVSTLLYVITMKKMKRLGVL